MSEVVDTRIVEAKFDSAQFEKGVDKTVKKLDELKKSLNLEKTGDSITQLADKTKEASEKASGALDKLQHRFTDFAGMLKQKLLSGIADEIVGVVFKIKNAFEGLVHSLGSAQVSHGMQRYVDIMGSVRTMVFSGVDESVAYDTIGRLGTYADQTSYSLDQLVSTMSKFKTAGADLGTAERMVIGLSNAAASMGVNADDASRAYLNLQQAYSSGAMLQRDWISFESLPMVGEKFNQAILDAAVKMKTLEKQSDGTYKTINKIDKQVKTSGADSKGITAQNLGTKLSSRWFNKSVMEEVFGSTYYFNLVDLEDRGASEIASDIKVYEKAIKSTTDQVKDEQARLQDALKSGDITREQYAERLADSAIKKSYANLSSDFKENAPDIDEAKKELVKFLSDNGFENVDYETLYTKQFEMYLDTIEQQMLDKKTKELDKALADKKITLDEYNEALEEFKKNNNLTRWGWEAYRAGQEARSFTDVLNTLKDTISRGWATSFEYIFGRLDEAKDFFTWLTDSELANAIYSIGEFRNEVLKNWKEQGGRDALIEALETLDNLLGRILGRFAIFNSDSEDFDSKTSALSQRLTQSTKDFRDFTKRLDAWFTDERIERIHRIFEVVSLLSSTIKRAFTIALGFGLKLFTLVSPVLEKILDNIEKVITKIDSLFNARDAGVSDGLGSIQTGLDNILIAVQPLIDPLTKVIDIIGDIVSFFAEIAVGTFISNVEFFTDTLEFIIAILGGTPASGSSSILNALADAVKWLGEACSKAFEFTTGFFHNLYEDLLILFGLKERAPDSEGGYFENLKKYFSTNDFLASIKTWFEELPGKISELWTKLWNAILGTNTVENKNFDQNVYDNILKNGGFDAAERYRKSTEKTLLDNVEIFIKNLKVSIREKVSNIWESIFGSATSGKGGNFDQNVYDNILKNGGFDAAERYRKSTEQPLVKRIAEWVDNAVKDVKDWITEEVPKAISSIWNTIDEFFFGKKVTYTTKNALTGKEQVTTVRIKQGFSKWLDTAIKDVKKWITKDLPKAISSIWNTIDEFFFGKKVTYTTKNALTGKEQVTTVRIKEGFSKWLDTAIKEVEKWILDLPTQIKELWNKIIDTIFYTDADPNAINPETNEAFGPGVRIKNGLLLWLEALPSNIWKWITTDLPDIVKKIWNNILDFIVGPKVPEEMVGTPKEGNPDEVWTADERIKTGFWTWLTGIPGKILDWVNEKGGWLGVINDVWDAVIGFIVGPKVPKEMVGTPKEGNPDEVWTADERIKTGFWTWLEGIAGKVKGWIDSAPTKISEIWNSVLDAIFGAPEGEIDKVNNKKPFDQKLYDTLLAVNGKDAAEAYKKSVSKSFLDTAIDFIHSLGIDIGKILSELPAYIVEGWNFNVGLFDTLLSHITTWLDGKNNQQLLEQPVDDAVSEISEGIEDASGASPLLTAVISFGQSIGKLVTTTIPGLLSEAFTFVKTQGIPKLGSAIKELFGLDDNWWTQINESAETFGTNVATKIEELPDKIRSAVEAVKGFFSGETELAQIKKDIRKQFTVKDEDGNLQIVDPEGLKVALNAAEVQFRRARKDSGLWNAIKEIFGATGDFIKEIGPDILDAINEVFKWIGDKISLVAKAFESKREGESITDAITRTMTGKENEQKEPSALAQALGRIGETIKTLIIEIIPNFIKSGVSVIAQEIPNLFAGIFGGGDDATEETKKMLEENMEETLGAVGDTISLDNLIGSRALDMTEGKVKTSDLIESLKAQQEELGEILATTDPDKTPQDVKDKYAKVINALDYLKDVKEEYVNLSETGLTENDIDKESRVLDKASTNIFSIMETFANIAASPGGKTIAVLGAVALVIWALKSLVDQLVITDDPGWALKWGAINTAIKFVAGLLTYMLVLSATGNTEQIQNVEKILNKAKDFVIELGLLFVAIKGISAVTDSAESGGFIGSLKKLGVELGIIGGVAVGGDVLTTGIESWATNIAEAFQSAEIGFGDLFSAIDSMAAMADKVGQAKEVIGDIHDIFIELYEMFSATEVESIEKFDESKRDVPLGAFLMNGEYYYIDGDQVQKVEDADDNIKKINFRTRSFINQFTEIMQMFVQFSGVMSLFKEAVTIKSDENANAVVDSLDRLLKMKDSMKEFGEFSKEIEFEDFKRALTTIGSALQLYSLADVEDFNKPLENWRIENAVGLLEQLFGNHQLSDLIGTLSKDDIGDTDELIKNAESITIFAGALVTIAKACEDITDDTGGNIQSLLDTMKDITPGDNGEISSISLQFGELGNALASFAANTIGLTSTNLDVVDQALDAILRLAIGLKDIPNDSVLAKAFVGDKTLENFAIGVASLGDKLRDFFNAIDNLDANGTSVTRNRKNVDMALMTVESLSYAAAKIGNMTYVSDYFKNSSSWFRIALGDLSGLGTELMTFISEINSYDTEENKSINFNFVFTAIDVINKIIETIRTLPSYQDIPKRVKNVGEILLGEGSDKHSGVMGYLNKFFAVVIGISKDDRYFDVESTSRIIASYSDMVAQIVALLKEINGHEGDVLGVVDTTNPMEYLIPVFESVNNNYATFETFLNNVDKFNSEGLDKAQVFFDSLHSIATALYIFSQKDAKTGDFNVMTGLATLIGMRWESLSSVKDNILEIFGNGDFYGVGESAGKNLDAGLANGINTGGAILAAQKLADAISGEFKVSWKMHSPSKLFEEFGENADEGLAIGIDKNSDLPADAMGRTAEEIIAQYQAILDDPNATKQDKDMAKRILDSLFLDPRHLLGAKQQVKQNAEELKTTVEEANDAVISAVSEEELKKLTTKKMSLFEMALNVVAPWGEFHNNALHAAAEGPAKRIAYYLGNAIGNSVAKHKDDAESGLLSSIANSKLFEVVMTGVIPEFGTSMFAKLLRTIHNSDDLSPEANDVLDKYADFKWGDVSTYIANAYLKDVFPNVFAALNEHGGFDFTADNFDFKEALFPFMSGLLADISEMSDDEETKKICSVFGNFISKIFDAGLNDEGDWSFKTAKQNIHDNMGEFIGFVYSEVSAFTDDPRVKNTFGFGKMFANLFTGKGIFGDNNPFDSMLGETSAVTESMNNEFANFGSNILNMFGGLSDLPEDSLDLSPKITPVLEITDDFEAQAERANSLLDFNNGSIGGGGGSLNMPNTSLDLASQIEIPQPIDYTSNLNQIQTGIEYLQQGINSVGNSLSSMRFIIQGKEMVWTIGPDMMEYIGYEQTAGPGRYNS